MKLLYEGLILLALVLAGCNSDVFLEEADIPESQSVTIDGDGGEATFTIPLKGLVYFGPDLMSSSVHYCTYYNAAGEQIESNAPASEVARIVYETDFMKYELLRDGSRLTIRSVCRTRQYDDNLSVRLEYTYGVRFIGVTILPGKPLKLLEVAYPDGLTVDNRAKVTTSRIGFNNNAPLPHTFELRPYLNELASVLVECESWWSVTDRFTMPVPVYVDGAWEIREKKGILPDVNYTYEGPDRLTKVSVDIPANSHVEIFTDVIYTGAKARGYIVFFNETLERKIIENIKVTSYYPIKYEIRIEDVE